jgi:RimJ/RimL family protein N-acetyltransferase
MDRRLVTTSTRFELREVLPSDEALFLWIYQDPGMMEHLGGPMSVQAAKTRFQKWIDIWKRSDFGPCVLRLIGGSETVGLVAVFLTEVEGETVFEIGWNVLPKFQRQGIAFEAARAYADFAVQNLGAKVITAFPSDSNIASNRICEKLGMTRIKTISYPYGNGTLNSVYWRWDQRKYPELVALTEK